MLNIGAPSKLRSVLVISAFGLIFIYMLSDHFQTLTTPMYLKSHLTSMPPMTSSSSSFSPSLFPANPPDPGRDHKEHVDSDSPAPAISPPAQHLGDDEYEVGEDEDLDYGVSVFPPDDLTKHLVIPRLDTEDIGWVYSLPPELNITVKPYLVNPTPESPADLLTTPRNKGHEAMAYLTYLIDHYSDLPDIVLFIHPHQVTWHNNDLLLSSTQLILRELNYRRVYANGYMNLRCHHKPGCPSWINPENTGYHLFKVEEPFFAQSFVEMFGGEIKDVPSKFGAPCCAQFAVTKETVHSVRIGVFIKLRQWLLDTPLDDDISGRVFEYLWHYIFTSKPILCPSEHVCFCDGYGYCFNSDLELQNWFEKRDNAHDLEERLKLAENGEGRVEGEDEKVREEGMKRVRGEIMEMRKELEKELKRAKRRGRKGQGRKDILGDEFSG